MKFRSAGQGAELVWTDCPRAELVLASEKIVKETLAMKDTYGYIIFDEVQVDFYSIVDKNGLNSAAHTALRVAGRAVPFVGALVGPLIATTTRRAFGGDSSEKLVFIKLKDDRRVLLIVREGYMHLIRSKNKQPKDKISEKDMQWIKHALDERGIELV